MRYQNALLLVAALTSHSVALESFTKEDECDADMQLLVALIEPEMKQRMYALALKVVNEGRRLEDESTNPEEGDGEEEEEEPQPRKGKGKTASDDDTSQLLKKLGKKVAKKALKTAIGAAMLAR